MMALIASVLILYWKQYIFQILLELGEFFVHHDIMWQTIHSFLHEIIRPHCLSLSLWTNLLHHLFIFFLCCLPRLLRLLHYHHLRPAIVVVACLARVIDPNVIILDEKENAVAQIKAGINATLISVSSSPHASSSFIVNHWHDCYWSWTRWSLTWVAPMNESATQAREKQRWHRSLLWRKHG